MKNNNRKFLLIAVLTGIIGFKHASALEIKPGGLIFAHYEYTASQHLQNGTTSQGYNTFDVTRIYLNAEAKYDEKISAFVNLEADLVSRESKNNRVFLKHAELRYAFNTAAKLYFGFIGVPWRAMEEGMWTRFVAKDLEDAENIGFATDRAIRLSGKVPFLAYHVMAGNGEGTGADSTAGNENTSFNGGGRLKDYTLMVSISPFERLGTEYQGFKINAQAHKGDKNETTLRNRFFAGASYESSKFKAMFNYYNADNSSTLAPSRGEGFSTYGYFYPLKNFWLLGRFDHYNPNINAGGFSHNRYIYGAGYQLTNGVRVTVDQQYLQQETRTPVLQDENIFYVHSEVKF